MHEGWRGKEIDCPPTTPPPNPRYPQILTMFIETRWEKLFSVSSWRAFRNFKWPSSFHSLYPGIDPPPPPPIDYVHRNEMRNYFQYPLERHSETSNDQALLNPYDHYIKMKAYMRVVGGTLYPGLPLPYWLCSLGRNMRNCFQYPLESHSETSNDQVLLNPFDHYIKMKAYMRVERGGGHFTAG